MTELVIKVHTRLLKLLELLEGEGAQTVLKPKNWRRWIFYGSLSALLLHPETRRLLLEVLRNTYLTVVVFVAATLAIFYFLEDWFRVDVAALLQRHRRIQPMIAALVGALPGCGGAIMVVTQYVKGGISFGALIAVLTATMGDAAFLLLARKPLVALGLFAVGALVGTVTGMVVDAIHGPDFLRSKNVPQHISTQRDLLAPQPLFGFAWLLALLPGLVLGLADAFQLNLDGLLGFSEGFWLPSMVVGVAGGTLSMLMWDLLPYRQPPVKPKGCRVERKDMFRWQYGSTISRIVNDTNFVTKWVVMAFLFYELLLFFSGVELGNVFRLWAPLVPLVAVLMGFIPGCGPQVLVTALYVDGFIPFSAQLGNAISNDGDALFPAIAIAPKASIVATLYSAIPAVLMSYGWYWLFERGG